MKTVKNEEYKGYKIRVEVEYKEFPAGYITEKSKDGQDVKRYEGDRQRVDIRTTVNNKLGNFLLSGTEKNDFVEIYSGEHKVLYEKLTKKIDEVYTKAKQYVDRKIREKEMTEGLPESLLEKSHNATLHERERVLNAKDTENLLKAIEVSKEVTKVISEVDEIISNLVNLRSKDIDEGVKPTSSEDAIKDMISMRRDKVQKLHNIYQQILTLLNKY